MTVGLGVTHTQQEGGRSGQGNPGPAVSWARPDCPVCHGTGIEQRMDGGGLGCGQCWSTAFLENPATLTP